MDAFLLEFSFLTFHYPHPSWIYFPHLLQQARKVQKFEFSLLHQNPPSPLKKEEWKRKIELRIQTQFLCATMNQIYARQKRAPFTHTYTRTQSPPENPHMSTLREELSILYIHILRDVREKKKNDDQIKTPAHALFSQPPRLTPLSTIHKHTARHDNQMKLMNC